MATNIELARLAAAVNMLRPDWPTGSIQGYLINHHAERPFVDIAIALVVCALDEETQTPRRVEQSGNWWRAARAATGRSDGTQSPRAGDPVCERHDWEYAANCRACIADAKAGDA